MSNKPPFVKTKLRDPMLMVRDFEDRCTRHEKIIYLFKQGAELASKRMSRPHRILQAYKSCGGYHIGQWVDFSKPKPKNVR